MICPGNLPKRGTYSSKSEYEMPVFNQLLDRVPFAVCIVVERTISIVTLLMLIHVVFHLDGVIAISMLTVTR